MGFLDRFTGRQSDEERENEMVTPSEDEKPKENEKRKRKDPFEAARDMEERGRELIRKARAKIQKEQRRKMTNAKKSRLGSLSGMLMQIIDECQLPDGITDNDYMRALRLFLAALIRQKDEETEAYKKRVYPVFETAFPAKDRTPAQLAAVRILTGHSKAAELVAALRPKKAKDKADKASTEAASSAEASTEAASSSPSATSSSA